MAYFEIMGPGFLVFFQNEYPEGGFKELFNYPDTPPKARATPKKKKKKVEILVERIARKVVDKPEVDQELALRLALVNEEMRYNQLYFELLKKEIKRRKSRRKAIVILLTGDG